MQRFGMCMIWLALIAGCDGPPPTTTMTPPAERDSVVLLSVTSDATENPQAVDMAMKLAGFSVDEGREVFMFFNVKGVKVPSEPFPADFAFADNQPLKQQLQELIGRGVVVHVCPICMKAHGIEKADLVEGAQVTTRPELFARIGPETSVFTY